MRDKKTGTKVSQSPVNSLKYDKEMVKRKWLFMKVLFTRCVYFELFKTIKLSFSLGGEVTRYEINM